MPSWELYLVFGLILSMQGTKNTFIVDLGMLNVWMELDWSKCLGQSGIWTSLDGGLWVTVSLILLLNGFGHLLQWTVVWWFYTFLSVECWSPGVTFHFGALGHSMNCDPAFSSQDTFWQRRFSGLTAKMHLFYTFWPQIGEDGNMQLLNFHMFHKGVLLPIFFLFWIIIFELPGL